MIRPVVVVAGVVFGVAAIFLAAVFLIGSIRDARAADERAIEEAALAYVECCADAPDAEIVSTRIAKTDERYAAVYVFARSVGGVVVVLERSEDGASWRVLGAGSAGLGCDVPPVPAEELGLDC